MLDLNPHNFSTVKKSSDLAQTIEIAEVSIMADAVESFLWFSCDVGAAAVLLHFINEAIAACYFFKIKPKIKLFCNFPLKQ